jgi:bifunctional enzyme CysN/CysC
MIVLSAFISPYRSDRERARAALANLMGAAGSFHEVFVSADLTVCEGRDPKGLYKRARAGEIIEFTGISAPYEPPENPDLVIDTAGLSIEDAVEAVLAYVGRHFPVIGA